MATMRKMSEEFFAKYPPGTIVVDKDMFAAKKQEDGTWLELAGVRHMRYTGADLNPIEPHAIIVPPREETL